MDKIRKRYYTMCEPRTNRERTKRKSGEKAARKLCKSSTNIAQKHHIFYQSREKAVKTQQFLYE